ncbi:MAG: xanthine dehydrogenase molybdopterin binding subunit, partial [Xanthobacteraceae bacterium]|nr:xanthine dehydrogenase molybdopterin binding subunit [Xanthobacteraceae bacterium]
MFGRTPLSVAEIAQAPDVAAEAVPRTVGIDARHDSAVRHVRGNAVYVDDIREPEGTLHLAVGGAPISRGRINNIDLAAVRAAPGVVRVLTAADIPGRNDASPVNAGDDPILATDSVEFHHQAVFVVVAQTRDAARRAAKLGKIEI